MAHNFVNKLREKFQHVNVGNVIGDLCEESINEFCCPSNDDVGILSGKQMNYDIHTKQNKQLFEEMCEKFGDVIINVVIGKYFFRQHDKFLPRLKDALEVNNSLKGKDTDMYHDWELFLNILKDKVLEEINKVKNSNEIEFKGDFPNQLEFKLGEEVLENVGDCYYKEHTENFFLRYYFKKNTDEFVIGLKITDTYCQIIHHSDQMFESLKIAPIVLADNENKSPLVCSLTYNKWNSDTQAFLNNGGHLPNDISIFHYTTIGRFFDSDEPMGYKLYTTCISLGKDSDEMQNAIEELIKRFVNKEESIKFSAQKSLMLKFNETDESEIELSGVDWWCSSSARIMNDDHDHDTMFFDVNTNFSEVFNLVQNRTGGISEYLKDSPQNLLEVVWVCGDSTFLVHLDICIEREKSKDHKYFLSVIPERATMRDDTFHIQYLFNLLLFNVQPSLNFICQTPSPYPFQSDFLTYLRENVLLSNQQDWLKDFLKKEYNGKMDLFKNLVDSTELVMVYLSNILMKSKLSVLPVATFMKFVSILSKEIEFASRDDLKNGSHSISSVVSTGQSKKQRGRPKKVSGNSSVKSTKKSAKHKASKSPEVVPITKRLKSSLVRSCTKEQKQYAIDAMETEDNVNEDNINDEEDNVKTKLIMEEENDHDENWDRKTIVWKPKISKTELPQGAVLLPDALKERIRTHVLDYFERTDTSERKVIERTEKTDKKEVHDFLMNFFETDMFKNTPFKQSFDQEYERRKGAPGRFYGPPLAAQMGMTQIIMKACEFKQYNAPSIPTGSYFYLKRKQGV